MREKIECILFKIKPVSALEGGEGKRFFFVRKSNFADALPNHSASSSQPGGAVSPADSLTPMNSESLATPVLAAAASPAAAPGSSASLPANAHPPSSILQERLLSQLNRCPPPPSPSPPPALLGPAAAAPSFFN